MKNFQKIRLQTPRFIYFSPTPDHQIYNPETEHLAAEKNGVRQWTEQALGDLKQNTKDAWTAEAGEQLSEGISRQERAKRLVQAGDMAYPVVKGMLQGNKNWSAEKTEWSSVKNLPVQYNGAKVNPKPTKLAEMDLIYPGMEIEIKEIGGQMTVILRDEPAEPMLIFDPNAESEAEAGVSDSATVSTVDSAAGDEVSDSNSTTDSSAVEAEPNVEETVVDETGVDSGGADILNDSTITETPASNARIRATVEAQTNYGDDSVPEPANNQGGGTAAGTQSQSSSVATPDQETLADADLSTATRLAPEEIPELRPQSIPAVQNSFAAEEIQTPESVPPPPPLLPTSPDSAVTPEPEVETPPSIVVPPPARFVPPSWVDGVPPNSQLVPPSAESIDETDETLPPSPTQSIESLTPNLQQIAREAMTKAQNFESAESRPFNISYFGGDLEFDGAGMFDKTLLDGAAAGNDKDWARLSSSQREKVAEALNDWWERTRGPEFQRQQINQAVKLVKNEWDNWTSSVQNPFGSDVASGRIIAIKFVAEQRNVTNLNTISGFNEILQSLTPKSRQQLRDTLNRKWAEKISNELQKKLFNSIDFESLPTTNFNKPFAFTNGKIVFHEDTYNHTVIFDSSNSEWAQLSLTDRMKLSTKLNQKFADN